ncbi:hypothetical protein HZ994_07745 [Akkermansiaceae bacterium]|nr:hypothetical protein HZ994_07745 [Akkermansiaceae bacterium]
MKTTPFLTSLALAGLSLNANAASILPISSITGFSGGDSYTPQDFTPLTNGFGITKPDANDPSTWTNGAASPSGGAIYKDEWYDHYLVAAANGKLAWVSFDLGSAQTTLDNLYIINSDAQSNITATATFNIYHAVTPTVALPAPPGGNQAVDYDFASGGWTQLGSTQSIGVLTSAYAYDLSGITSARYIALEIMTAFKPSDGRVGFDEIAITAIPEPSAALLGGLGMLALLRRRR